MSMMFSIPRPIMKGNWQEQGLLLAFQLEELERKRVAGPDEKPKKGPQPEIPAPEGDHMPEIAPEVPEPSRKPEVGPGSDPVVESPALPDMPEVGVPGRDLPGGTLH